MTADEAVALLDKVGHITIVSCDQDQFYVYSCTCHKDGSLDTDKQTDAGESCDTIEQALDAFASQFTRD